MEQKKAPGKTDAKGRNSLVRYSAMATQMAAIILVFMFIGMWLDSHFESENSIYTAILTIVGVVLSMYYMIKDLLK